MKLHMMYIKCIIYKMVSYYKQQQHIYIQVQYVKYACFKCRERDVIQLDVKIDRLLNNFNDFLVYTYRICQILRAY